MAAPPTGFAPRREFASAWNGTKLVVWGGLADTGSRVADGAAYTASSDSWATIAASALSARKDPATAFASTSGDVLIWGGSASGGVAGDGAGYVPFTNSWNPMTTSPLTGRAVAMAVWSGTQEFIFGGSNGAGGFLSDGARYNPVAATWATLDAPPLGYTARILAGYAPITGGLAMYGGLELAGSIADDGLAYDASGHPLTISTPPSSALANPDRYGPVMWCDDAKATCWVWGGVSGTSTTPLPATGAAFTYPGLTWSPMDSAAAPTGRVYSAAVWTGKSAIVWGGLDDASTGATCTNTGAIFTP
jgi:hypothetical protein